MDPFIVVILAVVVLYVGWQVRQDRRGRRASDSAGTDSSSSDGDSGGGDGGD